ncbi:MAG: hypothetical protein ACPG1C_04895 [Alphaproteobacteria bacterium]
MDLLFGKRAYGSHFIGIVGVFLVCLVMFSVPAQSQTGDEMAKYLTSFAADFNAAQNLPLDNGQGTRIEKLTSGHRELAVRVTLTGTTKAQIPPATLSEFSAAMDEMVLGIACDIGFNSKVLAFVLTSKEHVVVSGTYLDDDGLPILRVEHEMKSAMCYR